MHTKFRTNPRSEHGIKTFPYHQHIVEDIDNPNFEQLNDSNGSIPNIEAQLNWRSQTTFAKEGRKKLSFSKVYRATSKTL